METVNNCNVLPALSTRESLSQQARFFRCGGRANALVSAGNSSNSKQHGKNVLANEKRFAEHQNLLNRNPKTLEKFKPNLATPQIAQSHTYPLLQVFTGGDCRATQCCLLSSLRHVVPLELRAL